MRFIENNRWTRLDLNSGLAWSVLLSTTIFFITKVKMLWTYEARFWTHDFYFKFSAFLVLQFRKLQISIWQFTDFHFANYILRVHFVK